MVVLGQIRYEVPAGARCLPSVPSSPIDLWPDVRVGCTDNIKHLEHVEFMIRNLVRRSFMLWDTLWAITSDICKLYTSMLELKYAVIIRLKERRTYCLHAAHQLDTNLPARTDMDTLDKLAEYD